MFNPLKLRIMNIEINIPANDYVQPTEVRQEVVQAICDAFLETHCWSIYHPFRDGRGRNPTCLVVPKTKRCRASFSQEDRDSTKTGIKFNGAEMKAAFSALRKAGYHIFRVYEYGSWLGYVCDKKPFLDGGMEVEEFNHFID
jgi:hypothetical protein